MNQIPSKDAVLRELIQLDYYSYVQYHHKSIYKYTRHGEAACNILNEAVERRKRMLKGLELLEIQYIRFFMPPQHGKSMHITETFPSYFLCQFPREGCIEVSYSETYAEKFGSRNRDKLKETGPLFKSTEFPSGIGISKDTNAKGEWEIIDLATGKKIGGGMISRGILSGITGSSLGDCVIIDDPIKNDKEAYSEAYRNQVWNEWESSISTRIHPGAIVILIMTLWHEDDLWGRMDKKEYGDPLPWNTYMFPLEAEQNDYLGRRPGEPLWPERYGYDYIAQRKQYKKSYAALYQGRPTPEEGNIFKKQWLRFWVRPGQLGKLPPVIQQIGTEVFESLQMELPEFDWANDMSLQSWDMSFDDTAASAFVAGGAWAKHKADSFLLDQYREHADFPTTIAAFEAMTAKWPKILMKLVENKANGPAAIKSLNRKISGIVPVSPDGDKIVRAHAVSPAWESGNVWLPHPAIAPWVNDFVAELLAFPNSKYKDQVDEMTQALNQLEKQIYQVPVETEMDKLAQKYGTSSAEYQIFREMVEDDSDDNKLNEEDLGL